MQGIMKVAAERIDLGSEGLSKLRALGERKKKLDAKGTRVSASEMAMLRSKGPAKNRRPLVSSGPKLSGGASRGMTPGQIARANRLQGRGDGGRLGGKVTPPPAKPKASRAASRGMSPGQTARANRLRGRGDGGRMGGQATTMGEVARERRIRDQSKAKSKLLSRQAFEAKARSKGMSPSQYKSHRRKMVGGGVLAAGALAAGGYHLKKKRDAQREQQEGR